MPGDGSLDIQGAIYNALSAINPPLVGGRIFDYVKADIQFPFVRIDGSFSVPADVDSFSGADEIVQISVYSQEHGKKQLKEVMSQIIEALHETDLQASGRDTALCWWDGSNVQLDQDGVTHQGVMRFRILSFEAE